MFRGWIGGEEKINEYCHNLALEGGKILAQILGTSIMDPNGEFTANMVNVHPMQRIMDVTERLQVNVEIPLHAEGSSEVNDKIRDLLLDKWNIYAAHFYHNTKWWVRCSTQIWNEVSVII